ncbi:N-acetyltransferase family protein [Microbulbifer sp. MCCC 1A16149]|uniref:GNAT family N-acetyltransferase n=1 Tax=Microbulbifer sp. MCCC 1A16149 TaxID=3411322 RepID=UPI003D13A89E
MKNINIREAVIEDSALILHFVRELARYEKAEHEVIATQADIEKSIFGKESTVHALICEGESAPIGFAVYFFNYSTWQGKNGLYLEDLYVSPEHRGSGAGKALLKYLAKIAVSKNCGRFEWSVLDWNEPAIKFYESIGAKPKSEWVGYQLAGEALTDFSKSYPVIWKHKVEEGAV